MHRYPILFLIISISLLVNSCAVKTVEGFSRAEKAADVYKIMYFTDAGTDYVYKANIAVYGRDFGGIFIAKKINETSHRVAFTTEFGNKLFDFEISDTDFKVNYILEELDKKIIVNTLRKDFILLLKREHVVNEQFENDKYIVYKASEGKRNNYLFVGQNSKSLTKIVNATAAKEKVIISFVPQSPVLANKIIIDHKNIKLKIELNYLNNQ
jgi:hypothetical protein